MRCRTKIAQSHFPHHSAWSWRSLPHHGLFRPHHGLFRGRTIPVAAPRVFVAHCFATGNLFRLLFGLCCSTHFCSLLRLLEGALEQTVRASFEDIHAISPKEIPSTGPFAGISLRRSSRCPRRRAAPCVRSHRARSAPQL